MGVFMTVQLAVLLKEQEQGGDVESRINSRNTELLPFNAQADAGRNPSAPTATSKSTPPTSLHESLHADLKRAQAHRLSSS